MQAAGGALFVWRSWQLYLQPDRRTAMANTMITDNPVTAMPLKT